MFLLFVFFYLSRVYCLHERLVNLRSDYNLRLKSSVTQVTLQQTSQKTTMKVRPELDDVTLRYIQDLLAWVEENQRRIDDAQWGSDLPSVESQLGSHRGLHQTVEDFRSKIERAKADEVGIPVIEIEIGIGGELVMFYYICCIFAFSRANSLLSAKARTEIILANWTYSMGNYW